MKKWKYYKKIFSYFKNNKKEIMIYGITSIVIVIFNTISPMLSAKILESVTNTNLKLMFKYALLIFIIAIFERLIYSINNNASNQIHDDVELNIKTDVSKELFNLEIKNFDKEGTGFFAQRIDREPGCLSSIFNTIQYYFTSTLSSAGILIYIFSVSYIIGFYFIIISLIMFYLNYIRTKFWEKERKKIDKLNEKYTSDFNELIRGIKDIKVLNLKNILINKIAKEQKTIADTNEKHKQKEEKYYTLNNFVWNLSDFLFIILGILLIKSDTLSGTSFLIIYMYKGQSLHLVSNINSIYRSFKEFNLSLERLYELIDGVKYPKEKFGSLHLDNLNGSIEFKNVNFAYDKKKILNNLSFKIKPHETIGIVGKSGAGKTTIFNLINKLYNINQGQILIDGVNINDLDEKTIRENIATITQEPYIFNMSIKDNLLLANPDIKEEEMINKCKLCLFDDYVNTLDNKYDTLVGENGVILSGGLKQRMAIIRTLLKNNKIILLDEATSSLDNETQDQIQKAIHQIKSDYTILIIAHRLTTVIDCDKILVIDNGQVVGFDSHENLIKNNKYYRKLYQKELL